MEARFHDAAAAVRIGSNPTIAPLRLCFEDCGVRPAHCRVEVGRRSLCIHPNAECYGLQFAADCERLPRHGFTKESGDIRCGAATPLIPTIG
jgi:hypothetical protein